MSRNEMLTIYAVSVTCAGFGVFITSYFSGRLTGALVKQTGKKRTTSSAGSSQRRSLTVISRQKAGEFTKIGSVLCTWLFTSCMIIRCALSSVVFTYIIQAKDYEKKWDEIINHKAFIITFTVMLLCNVLAFAILSILCFERVYNVFQCSQYSLNPQIVTIMRTAMIISNGCAAIGMVCWAAGLSQAAFILVAPPVIVYPFLLGYSSFTLLNRTTRISRAILLVRNNSNMDSSGMEIQKQRDCRFQLLNASLRLTIVTSSVILSSLLHAFILLALYLTGNMVILLFQHISNILDVCCNVYSLICAFSLFEKEYMFIYGALHTYLLKKLTFQ